jgi:hypothetical protein
MVVVVEVKKIKNNGCTGRSKKKIMVVVVEVKIIEK